jgi:ATP-dependent DNA helicase 2 subunit 1
MLKEPPASDNKKADRDCPTLAALKCAYQLMQQRIISNPHDMMGVLLFGTEQSKFEDEDGKPSSLYPHCYLLTNLDVPSALDVKRLRNLVENEDEARELLVPSSEPVSMANVLFCANLIFATRAPNFLSRRLFLVTDNDDPHENDKELKAASTVRAKDLYDLGVMIELFPIASPGGGFDRAKFYDDIVYRVPTSDPEAPAPVVQAAKPSSSGDGISLLQSLLSSVNSKAAPRRALFSLPFEIGPGLRISISGYTMLKRQEPVKSCYVWVNGEKPEIATLSSTQHTDDTARTVEKQEVQKAYKFGGEQVPFTKDEIAAIRNFGDPILRIIGFKPMSMLPIWASTRSSTFIYPSETDYIGSSRVFSALQQKLIQDRKIGVAWFIARKNATPVLAAIYPGEEQLNDDGEQAMPPGLWIIPLPFADDIRQNPETILVSAPDVLKDKMRVIIQQLQLPKARYDPNRYPNPSLQWFYRILQALALDEELPEQAEDKTVPRARQIDKRAGAYVQEWGEELEKALQEWMDERRSIKREADFDGEAPAKRAKTSASSAKASTDIDDAEMKRHFEKLSISKVCAKLFEHLASTDF